MRKFAVCLGLALTLLLGRPHMVSATDTLELIAIDVLLLPDATMVRRVIAMNHLPLQDSAWGFALDATHVPHMTLLQCFVRRADLGAVEAAIETVFRQAPPVGMELTASGYFNSPVGNVNATGITVRDKPALARLQHDIVAGTTPLIRHGGSAAAFVDAPQSETIGWTVAYVDRFLTNSSGPNYSPHVTAGAGGPNFVARITSGPLTEFDFKIVGAGIYQQGDIGTARKRLWQWRQ